VFILSCLKLVDDVNKCKETYECRLSKLVQHRMKYEAASRKGFTTPQQYLLYFCCKFFYISIHFLQWSDTVRFNVWKSVQLHQYPLVFF